MKHYDVVVIGAGSGGLTSAVGFSKVGKKVLLIEKEKIGGECTNSGCIPSKAFLHHARTYHHAITLAGKTSASEHHGAAALTYVRSKIDQVLAEETSSHFVAMGIDVVMGDPVFTSENSLSIANDTVKFSHCVIATGSAPRQISIPGLEERFICTNQNLFKLEAVPKKLLVVGGGPIGLEMGQAMAMLGSSVTLITPEAELASREDRSLRTLLQQSCRDLGITVHTNARFSRVEGTTAIVLDIISETEHQIPFDKVLVAVGRVPVVPKGLPEAGVTGTELGIVVSSQYQTSNKRIYAVGDVASKDKFTHSADDAARQVVAKIVSRGLLRVKKKHVPKVTYTIPELASVGLSEKEALLSFGADGIHRIEVPYATLDRAKTDQDEAGVLVLFVRRLSGKIVGAHIAGTHAGELLSFCTLAIEKNISLFKLQSLIYPYPTYALMFKKAGDIFVAAQISTLKSDLKNALINILPKTFAVVFWASLVIGFQYYKLSNGLSYEEILFSLLDFFTTTMWGPLLYMVLYAIRPLILFPATLLTALSGALFGLWWGILFTVIGENASANFAYSIGRYFGKDWHLENSLLGKWVTALREKPFESVLFMRLFYVPFDLTNYGSGILKIPWVSYALATVIGILPGLTTFVALGAAVDIETLKTDGISFNAFDPRYLALSVGLFIASIVLSKYLKKRRES